MYSLDAHAEMAADKARMSAYREAIARTVKPGAIVMDIGAGCGVFSLIACKLGARKVYAVEPSDAIHATRVFSRENGCEGTVETIKAFSYDLPSLEPIDVIVSDIRGALPLFGRHIPAIIDARTRFLKPGGVLVPARDRLWAAMVSAPDWYKYTIEPLGSNTLGLDLSRWQEALTNTVSRMKVKPESLLTDGLCWAELDYMHIQTPDVEAKLEWTVQRAGTAHGIALWFDTKLHGAVGFSSRPGSDVGLYGRLVLPLSQPVPLIQGDQVHARVRATLVGDEYVWRWDTEIFGQGDGSDHPVEMHQSTFFADALMIGHFGDTADAPVQLNDEGRITQFVLAGLEAGWQLDCLARHLVDAHPAQCPSMDDAARIVRNLAQRFLDPPSTIPPGNKEGA